jgi:hypothetical protein
MSALSLACLTPSSSSSPSDFNSFDAAELLLCMVRRSVPATAAPPVVSEPASSVPHTPPPSPPQSYSLSFIENMRMEYCRKTILTKVENLVDKFHSSGRSDLPEISKVNEACRANILNLSYTTITSAKPESVAASSAYLAYKELECVIPIEQLLSAASDSHDHPREPSPPLVSVSESTRLEIESLAEKLHLTLPTIERALGYCDYATHEKFFRCKSKTLAASFILVACEERTTSNLLSKITGVAHNAIQRNARKLKDLLSV